MKAHFNDIFEYHFEFNNRLIAELKRAKEQLPSRSYPLFCHVLNAHHIWNARILNTPSVFGVHERYEISSCSTINENNYKQTLRIIAEYDFSSLITYSNTKGQNFTNKISDILFHIANHSTHHKGQLISDFRAAGIEPIVTDYILYKRK